MLSLCCTHTGSLDPELPTERTAETLIRLDRCNADRIVLSCHCSFSGLRGIMFGRGLHCHQCCVHVSRQNSGIFPRTEAVLIYLLVSSADNFCKQLGPRPGPKECLALSGSKLFDTLIEFLK